MTLKVPVRPRCSVCGGEIPAGTGLFIASGAGPDPEPVLTYCHSGSACPAKAGCVVGGPVIFGEIPALMGVIWEGSSQVTCGNGGPVYLKAQWTGGSVVAELLEGLIAVLSVVVLGLTVARLVR